MVDAGFELEEGDFWRKGAVLFGRGAALQKALLELHENGRDNTLARNWIFANLPSGRFGE